jgi:tripartite-type tricarboxylate transporter receptor subunit TctC
MKKMRIMLIGLVCLLLLTPALVLADYPERDITIYCGTSAGGTTDLAIRVLADMVGKDFGKPVVVVNKAGAAHTLATNQVSKSKPDGYTLGAVSSAAFVEVPHFRKMPYDVNKDFTWIATYTQYNCGLVVKKDAPWKTLAEFLDYAKKNPGKIMYSSAGYGSGGHIMMEYLASEKGGIDWKHVPLSGGSKMSVSLLGGHTHAWSAAGTQTQFIRDGSMRLLVSYNKERTKESPDVPTLWELGYKNLPSGRHLLIVGPKGIPDSARKKLETAFMKAMNTPDYLKFLDNIQCPPTFADGKTTASNMETDYKIWGKFIKLTGMKTTEFKE